jgi:hypothetical protein
MTTRKPELGGLNGSDLVAGGSDLDAALSDGKRHAEHRSVEVNRTREHRPYLW